MGGALLEVIRYFFNINFGGEVERGVHYKASWQNFKKRVTSSISTQMGIQRRYLRNVRRGGHLLAVGNENEHGSAAGARVGCEHVVSTLEASKKPYVFWGLMCSAILQTNFTEYS